MVGALRLELDGGGTVVIHGLTPQESYRRQMLRAERDVITRATYPWHSADDCADCARHQDEE